MKTHDQYLFTSAVFAPLSLLSNIHRSGKETLTPQDYLDYSKRQIDQNVELFIEAALLFSLHNPLLFFKTWRPPHPHFTLTFFVMQDEK